MPLSQRSRKRARFPIILLLMLLLASPAAKPHCAEKSPPDLSPAWDLLRAGETEKAKAAFSAALDESPGRVEALNGLGYVHLREGNPEEAARLFNAALKQEPADRDALVGRAIADYRRGDHRGALRRLNLVVRDHPGDGEAKDIRLRAERALADRGHFSPPREEHHTPAIRPKELDLPMRARGTLFELRRADGSYRPLFLKAVNLGAALPGKFPSQFPTDDALYLSWFRKMRECGFTAVRLYTIFPPVFYTTLASFNRSRPDPLYLIHGVWVEPPQGDDFSDQSFTGSFRAEIRRVVDLLHGALDLPKRPGHASGSYTADVSPWWIATILGREWEPFTVTNYRERNPGTSNFRGRFLTGKGVDAMERWLAEQADYAVSYETDLWNAQRPIAWTNWPTLDPLHHPTESTKAEEERWRVRLGLPPEPGGVREYDNDAAGIDLEKFAATEENRGGLFASYHAYPYYPDFMIYDPGYNAAEGPGGRNAYLGYLRDIARHHEKHPLFIAEFGVPTSREIAHTQPQGWTHGGHGEREQGEINARLFRSIYESGATGGALFAWIDEWFKHNWLVIEYHLPMERNRLWHDRQDAEQNYGLIAYRAGKGGPSVVIDGRDDEWDGKDPLLSAEKGAGGVIRSLSVTSDETDLFLLLRVAPGTKAGFAVMIDVIDAALGSINFAGGLDLESSVGFEASLLFDGERARIVLDNSFDRLTNRYKNPIRPHPNRKGAYVSPRIKPNRRRITRSGRVIGETVLDTGWLRRATTDRSDPGFDDRGEWYFDGETGTAEFRVPWGILNVTDPSSRAVLFEGKDSPRGFRETEGLRFAVAAFEPEGGGEIRARRGKALDVLPRPGPGGTVTGLPLYAWKRWEAPAYHSFPKRSFFILKEALGELPDEPKGR